MPSNRTEGYSFHLIGCPIAKHAKEHGYEELLSYLVRLIILWHMCFMQN